MLQNKQQAQYDITEAHVISSVNYQPVFPPGTVCKNKLE